MDVFCRNVFAKRFMIAFLCLALVAGFGVVTGNSVYAGEEKAAENGEDEDGVGEPAIPTAVIPLSQRKIGPISFPAGRKLHEVVRWIAVQVGVNIVIDRDIDEVLPHEISLPRRLYWMDVLTHVAELTNCEVRKISEDLYKLIQPPKINIRFHNANIHVVLDLLARQSGENIVISPKVEGEVSVSFNNVRWDVALETIVKTLDYVTVREDNDIIRVVTRESLKAQLETRIFQLAYIRPPDNYRAKMETGRRGSEEDKSGGGFWDRSTEDFSKDRVERFTLYQALKDMVNEELGGKLRYDLATNSFLITDTKPRLDEMEKIIKQVDVPPTQVFVDVKFIRTTQGDLMERGIHLDDLQTPEEEGLIIRQWFPDPVVTSTTSGGRTKSDMDSRGGTYWWDVGRFETLRENFNMLGILDFTQTNMLLRLINSDDNTRIVQAPKLLTLNNQEAVIFVGESVPYVAQKANIDQNGNITITIEKDADSPISVGFTLFVTPHVVKDSDEIMLTVIPRTSTLIGTSSVDNPGFSRFSAVIAEGVVTYLDLPRTLDQTIVTKMLVRDGNTAVIGGLISEDRREKVAKVPILSSIPIIGNLFTWKREYAVRENLVIFITPRIVRTKSQSAELARYLVAKQKELDYFYEKYGKTDPSVQATTEEESNLGTVLTAEELRRKEEERQRLEEIRRHQEEMEKLRKEEEEKESVPEIGAEEIDKLGIDEEYEVIPKEEKPFEVIEEEPEKTPEEPEVPEEPEQPEEPEVPEEPEGSGN